MGGLRPRLGRVLRLPVILAATRVSRKITYLIEGLSKKEIIRCLKRYVAREVYRHLRPAA